MPSDKTPKNGERVKAQIIEPVFKETAAAMRHDRTDNYQNIPVIEHCERYEEAARRHDETQQISNDSDLRRRAGTQRTESQRERYAQRSDAERSSAERERYASHLGRRKIAAAHRS
jgi:hypothetical protein